MQVVINIDDGNFAPTMQEIFGSLTNEDKKEIAEKIILQVLAKPMDYERRAYEREVIDLLKSNGNYSGTDEQIERHIRNSWDYRNRMEKFQSSSDILLNEIVSGAVEVYKKRTKELVEEDEQLKAQWAVIEKELVNSFPSMVHNAMVGVFVNSLQAISMNTSSMFSIANNQAMLKTQLTAALAERGINITL